LVESAAAIFERIADAQQAANPSLSRPRAVSEAANHPDFVAALRRERVRKFGAAEGGRDGKPLLRAKSPYESFCRP
jgi:hypothetical protein